ncbi:MAG: hypothetical protein QM501_01735 [Gimesia sp.]
MGNKTMVEVMGVIGFSLLLFVLFYLIRNEIPDSKLFLGLLFLLSIVGLFFSKIALAYYLNSYLLRAFIYVCSALEGLLFAALIIKDRTQVTYRRFYLIAGSFTLLFILWQELEWLPTLLALPE